MSVTRVEGLDITCHVCVLVCLKTIFLLHQLSFIFQQRLCLLMLKKVQRVTPEWMIHPLKEQFVLHLTWERWSCK